MRHLVPLVLMLVTGGLFLDSATRAQPTPGYTPAVPAAPTYAPSWGYGETHASTAAQGAMEGLSSVVRSAGDYNLSTSAAMINVEEARSRAIQNQQQFTQTYFSMRQMNREAVAAERPPRPSHEQLVRMAQMGAPARLSPSELSGVTGAISWPLALTSEKYAGQRAELEKVFQDRGKNGAISLQQHDAVMELTEQMLDELKADIANMDPQQYVRAKRFVQSLAQEVRRPTT